MTQHETEPSKGGSDLYVMIENLRVYLESDEIQIASNGGFSRPKGDETHQVPILLGRRFQNEGHFRQPFVTGGGGYLLNKAALKILTTQTLPKCLHKHQTSSAEDYYISLCLRQSGVWPFMTIDEEGGQRFSHFKVC